MTVEPETSYGVAQPFPSQVRERLEWYGRQLQTLLDGRAAYVQGTMDVLTERATVSVDLDAYTYTIVVPASLGQPPTALLNGTPATPGQLSDPGIIVEAGDAS